MEPNFSQVYISGRCEELACMNGIFWRTACKVIAKSLFFLIFIPGEIKSKGKICGWDHWRKKQTICGCVLYKCLGSNRYFHYFRKYFRKYSNSRNLPFKKIFHHFSPFSLCLLQIGFESNLKKIFTTYIILFSKPFGN